MSHYVQTVRYLSQKLACLWRHTENRGNGFLGEGRGGGGSCGKVEGGVGEMGVYSH